MSRTGDNIIHVELATGEHYYFGGIAAIYDVIPYAKLRVKMETLWNRKITPENPYKNKFCIIRKDVIHRKPNQKKKD